MATIWDADVLIWAASQIVEARDAGLRPSRLMAATPYEILTFVGCGVDARDYARLKAALDRLQSTTIATTIRQPTTRRMHRFSWINEWKETLDASGRPLGLELILPDWFFAGVMDHALILTIDPTYFALTGVGCSTIMTAIGEVASAQARINLPQRGPAAPSAIAQPKRRPVPICRAAQGADRHFRVRQDTPGVRYKALAQGRQGRASAGAMKQPNPQFDLQVLDLATKRRLLHLQPGRRSRKMQLFRHGQERSHMP